MATGRPVRLYVGRIDMANRAGVRGAMVQLEKVFGQIYLHMRDASPEILEQALMPTFIKARDVYTPIDTGRLRRSGFLEIDGRGEKAHVSMGFGYRGFPRYAGPVHEMTHIKHEPPTRSKFLEAALTEDADKICDRIARGVTATMGTAPRGLLSRLRSKFKTMFGTRGAV